MLVCTYGLDKPALAHRRLHSALDEADAAISSLEAAQQLETYPVRTYIHTSCSLLARFISNRSPALVAYLPALAQKQTRAYVQSPAPDRRTPVRPEGISDVQTCSCARIS